MKLSARHLNFNRQRGVVLFVALIMLMILTLIGISMARVQTVEERIARNDQNHGMAVEAAEAALRSAENGLISGTYSGFVFNTNGMYQLDPSNASSYTATTATVGGASAVTVNWASPATSTTVTYSGPTLPVASPPKFIIEQLPAVAMPGENIAVSGYASGTPPIQVAQITAYSSGGDQTSSAQLQSIFRQ